jgi:hypothetical protein
VVDSTIKAASLFGAGRAAAIPVQVAALAEGVVKGMLLSKLKNAAAALLVVFCLALGASAVLSRTSAGERPNASGEGEPAVRTRWEYKALSHDEIEALAFTRLGMSSVETGLNLLGKDGWELVAIEPPVHDPAVRLAERPSLYVFKRQRP